MRDALLKDLAQLQQYEIHTLHDVRLEVSEHVMHSLPVVPGSFRQVFTEALKKVDFVWLIAPETSGTMLELSEICYEAEARENGPVFIGSGFDTMLTGTSKTLCFEALTAANIHTLPVYAGEDLIQDAFFETLTHLPEMQWVAKPEDGAGCEGIRLFDSLAELRNWITKEDRYLNYLAQPYQVGIAASISMLCRNGKAWLLSCNQQHIEYQAHHFSLRGVSVNGMSRYWQRFDTLARKIAQMLPDALGYLGADVIVDAENDKIYVLEINPRLTTSYAGLHESIGMNPAQLIMNCVLDDRFTMPAIAKHSIRPVNLEI